MNPYNLFVALFAVLGVVMAAPAFMFFSSISGVPTHVQFLASLVPPTLVALLGASWLEPGG